MTKEKTDCLLNKAVELWGKESQSMMMIEEMAELIKALCKDINRNKKDIENIHEEIVDVEIVLDQMKKIYKLDDEKIERIKNEKLGRLEERIKKYEEEEEITVIDDDRFAR